MIVMKRILILVGTLWVLGCYDLESGSTAKIFEDIDDDAKNAVSAGDNPNRAPVFWDECAPQTEDGSTDTFDAMKSGDDCSAECEADASVSCSSDFGCGSFGPDSFGDGRFGRWAYCLDGVISMTDMLALQEESPRADVVWSDCATAMADGRTGEACTGAFSCYSEVGNHCIEKVTCGEDDSEQGYCDNQLARYVFCDDALTSIDTTSETAVTNCEEAENATALTPCVGSFICEGVIHENFTNELFPVASCASGVGYCRDGKADFDNVQLVWCDNQKIRIFENMNLGLEYIPQTTCGPYAND